MVLADSHGIPRVPWYSGTYPASQQDFRRPGSHRLWPAVPGRLTNLLIGNSPALRPDRPYNPGMQACWFGLFRVRSPLLAESLLFSLPGGTEMVHFPPFASASYEFRVRMTRHDPRRVSPFGHPRIKACVRLPEAYRSLLRPSSPTCAKAFTVRP